MAKEQAGLTRKHFVGFDAITKIQSTLTAYGKLIEGGESTPSALGISHPHGIVAPLNKSLVCGVQVAGRCIRLPQPQEVALPTPDGPADGCGWDPSEFVVWKNLPRDWVTLHFQSRQRPLSSALSVGGAGSSRRLMFAGAVGTMGVDEQVVAIIRKWKNLDQDPALTDTLGKLWGDTSGPFSDGATKLAGMLNESLGTQIQGSDFSATTTVDDVIHDVLS
jgi:hypothetical protein